MVKVSACALLADSGRRLAPPALTDRRARLCGHSAAPPAACRPPLCRGHDCCTSLTACALVLLHACCFLVVQYNREGDLLFTCAKDNKPNVWWVENGERLGTFNGHQGSVYNCDVNFNSTRLLTGSSDRDCKLWDVVRARTRTCSARRSQVDECGRRRCGAPFASCSRILYPQCVRIHRVCIRCL